MELLVQKMLSDVVRGMNMSNQAVLKFISEHQNVLAGNLADILKDLNSNMTNVKLTEHMYETISNEYIHILMNESGDAATNEIYTIYQFCCRRDYQLFGSTFTMK